MLFTISIKVFHKCNVICEGQRVRHKFEPFTQIVKVKKLLTVEFLKVLHFTSIVALILIFQDL